MGFLNYLNEFLEAVKFCIQEALSICQGTAPSVLLQKKLKSLKFLESVDLQLFYYIIFFAFYLENCCDTCFSTASQNHVSNS